jgi:purine-binding chemotaxis protein CheW
MKTTPIRRFGQAPLAVEANPHLLLTVLGVTYAVPLLAVREAMDLVRLDAVPGAPQALMGTQVLRGHRIPVVDLGAVLEQRRLRPTRTSCTLVVEGGAPGVLVGLAVDGVSGVKGLAASDLAPPPQLGALGGLDVVSALASTDLGLVAVLDPLRILRSAEARTALAVWQSVEQTAADPVGAV